MKIFDSIQVKFEDTEFFSSPFDNTKIVPFKENYLTVIKDVLDSISTDYFWFFSSFMNMKNVDIEYVPKDNNLHVWYNTHPKGGTNKEGNVMLVPTKQFKEQITNMQRLSDFKDIQYHAHDNLYQAIITKIKFKLSDPREEHNKGKQYYSWLINSDLDEKIVPNFYPSFWDAVKIYTWGKTRDIMLVPKHYNVKNQENFDLEYPVKKMDVINLNEDTSLGYVDAAARSTTGYFFTVPTGGKIPNNFNFDYQPDRMERPRHYIFDGPVYLCNKKLCLDIANPGFDPKLAVKL